MVLLGVYVAVHDSHFPSFQILQRRSMVTCVVTDFEGWLFVAKISFAFQNPEFIAPACAVARQSMQIFQLSYLPSNLGFSIDLGLSEWTFVGI